ncbi:hypothetical protein MLD38_020306 [Melastoma candidum]|uniref:Uncharacterized protein n=1 Tax=Melastoma candidum TaxID=119954 RepID=A0ACB9QKI9_9MYRT|nr:hypothetical protein MLD38_020306 [Melastoma candidum]
MSQPLPQVMTPDPDSGSDYDYDSDSGSGSDSDSEYGYRYGSDSSVSLSRLQSLQRMRLLSTCTESHVEAVMDWLEEIALRTQPLEPPFRIRPILSPLARDDWPATFRYYRSLRQSLDAFLSQGASLIGRLNDSL